MAQLHFPDASPYDIVYSGSGLKGLG